MRKNVLITGATKGIGASIVRLLAKNDFNVIVTYFTNKEMAESLKNDIFNMYNKNILITYCDVTNEESINYLYETIKNKYGKLDVLINNACLCMDDYYMDKKKEDFIKVLDTNLVGPFLMIKKFNDILDGIIINMSSTDGIDTFNPYSIDYCASKAGLINMTKNMALVLNNKIVCLAPNYVDTESVLMMDKDFLKSELIRIGQKDLIKKENVALKVLEIINDKNLVSGSIVRMDNNGC